MWIPLIWQPWGLSTQRAVPWRGKPPYNPWAMLKLYLYGYQHGIHSSRKLEAETRRNLEVIWLVKGLRPSYKSIADFRKDHVRTYFMIY